MTLKKISCVAALAALIATPVMAQPTVTVEDGGLGSTGRIFNIYVTPGDSTPSSLAVELGLETEFGSSVDSAASNADWEDDGIAPVGNPGNNPFTGTETEGIAVDGGTVFAALGSTSNTLNAETMVLTVELATPIDVLQLGQTAQSIVAEDGSNNLIGPLEFGINGDFDTNGTVDTGDLGVFAGEFGTSGPDLLADFDNSGTVDTGDLGVFAGNFGLNVANNAPVAAAAAAPEPSAVLLGLLGVGSFVARSRRSR